MNNPMNDTTLLLEWFWKEHQTIGGVAPANGFCQCETEDFIQKSTDSEKLRAICLVATFIDQIMYGTFREIYPEFSRRFPCPKVYRCQTAGMTSPNWFVYSYHGYDKNADWDEIKKVATIMLGDISAFLSAKPEGSLLVKNFKQVASRELVFRFEPKPKKLLLGAVSEM
jgi:hypothetical protein